MKVLVRGIESLRSQGGERGKEVLGYSASLTGIVNDEEIIVTGSGNIVARNGLSEGTYELVALPRGFDARILEAVLVTGYPNACAPIDGCPNVFDGTSYHYSRSIAFCEKVQLSLTARCEIDGNRLRSQFRLQGEAPRVRLKRVEPLVEVWEPSGKREVAGRFRIIWRTVEDKVISADARTQYYPGKSTRHMPVLHRYISIVATVGGHRLTLRQKSLAFYHLPIDLD